jgi:hypothetical protein
MKRIPLIIGIVTLVLGAALLARQTNSSAEQESKLAVYVGQWTYEGEYSPSFSATAGKVTGEAAGAMILGGHFLEWQMIERGPGGETRGLEIVGYDPVNKNYPSRVFSDDGSMITGVYALEKNVSRFTAKMIAGGKEQLIRITEVFEADLMSFRQEAEISDDGHTWAPMFEGRFIRIAKRELP